MSYRVAKSSEYLVITGARIPDVKLAKKSWIWPGQRCTKINVSPVNYSVHVRAMSSEKLAFLLPAVFTIGPRIDDMDCLLKYVKLMPTYGKNFQAHVSELVNGIIQGETRVLAASMTIDEIFKGTKEFKQEVFDKIQLELNAFGLIIYNANVKQLLDADGGNYFYHLSRKVQTEAACNAKLDTAEADMKGVMGTKYREAMTVQNSTKLDNETRIMVFKKNLEGKKEEVRANMELKKFETQQGADVLESASELEVRRAICDGRKEQARIEATKASAIREAELQLQLEQKNALVSAERLRADVLNKASVAFEANVHETHAKFYQQQKNTDAHFYAEQKDAEVKKFVADVDLHVSQCTSAAELFAKRREAEALMAMADAQAYHVRSMLEAFGGDYNAFRDYMMISNGTYKEIARISAESVKGLKPKIVVATNGGAGIGGEGESGGEGLMGMINKITCMYKTLPPLQESVQEKTEMVPAPMGQCASAAVEDDGDRKVDQK